MEKILDQSRFEVLTPKGWQSFDGIKKTSRADSIILTAGELKLECTPEHLIKTPMGFMQASDLNVDNIIITETGPAKINNIYHNKISTVDFFDLLEVGGGNEYFTNSIISHNCEFLGSSGTLIDGSTLKVLTPGIPIQDAQGFTVYNRPEKNHIYVCIVDVSRGKGLDYSAFQLIDVTQMPYKQVAVYRNNFIPPVDYADIVHRISKSYNDAYILIEINDIGGQVSDMLHFEFEIETLLYTESAGRSGKRISSGFGSNVDKGIRTTKQVKAIGCSILKLLIEQQQLIVQDFNTINEISTFSRKGTSYEAEPGCHDDLVMGLVLFAWLSTQTFFKEITDINTMMKLREKTEQEIMDDLLPFGFTYDDIESELPSLQNPGGRNWLDW